MSQTIKFKDLRIGEFILLDGQYAIKINKFQIYINVDKVLSPDQEQEFILEKEFKNETN